MWAEVFLAQAKSDWEIYLFLKETSFPECHSLHYLQMATEKLAKAYLLAGSTNIESVRSTHRALIRFLKTVSRNKGLQEEIGMSAVQLHAHIQHLLPLAYEIETLAPSLAGDGPNPEYPWETPEDVFHAPVTHEFAVSKILNGPRGNKFLKLLSTAISKFYALHKA